MRDAERVASGSGAHSAEPAPGGSRRDPGAERQADDTPMWAFDVEDLAVMAAHRPIGETARVARRELARRQRQVQRLWRKSGLLDERR